MATLEPNKEWYRQLEGSGPVELEFADGETYVVEVRRDD